MSGLAGRQTVTVDAATTLVLDVLDRAGVPEQNARIAARSLIEAERRGLPSHGLLRLPRIVERIHNGVIDPTATGRHAWLGDSLLHVDAERGIGPVVATHALRALCDRAARTGVALGAVVDNNHLGMLALYADDVARQGLVLIALTTSEALVHPWGGRTAMIGTNPIAIGVPAEPAPFVLDMATGVVSMGKIHDHAARGEPLPAGWALDAHGRPTTDPVAASSGSIAPFGGAKGYALGLAFEVLVSALSGAALGTDVRGTLDSTELCTTGDVFIVARPSGSLAAVSAYLDDVRATVPADPAQPVLVPGDRARRARSRSIVDGIEVARETWARVQRLV